MADRKTILPSRLSFLSLIQDLPGFLHLYDCMPTKLQLQLHFIHTVIYAVVGIPPGHVR